MPARRGQRKPAPKETRETKPRAVAKQVEEPVQLSLVPNAGWTQDNFAYMKSIPKEKISYEIYAMFGIPEEYKISDKHPAVQIFVEFQASSFLFAQQFSDPSKALAVIAILSDYIGCVPSFSSSKDSFAEWIVRAEKQIEACEFTPQESQLITNYLNTNLRSNAHIVHFVLTNESIRALDEEGLKLFRPVIIEKKETTDEVNEDEERAGREAAEAAALQMRSEKLAQEAAERQAQLQAEIEAAMMESMERIKEEVEKRHDMLMAKLIQIEDQIEGTSKGKRRQTTSSE